MAYTAKFIAAIAGLALAVFFGLHAAAAGPQAAPAEGPERYTEAGTYTVATLKGNWYDTRRKREVPWLIRYPEDASGPGR